MCEVVLNLRMTHWTGPRQTGSLSVGPCGAKPRSASPIIRRYTLFFDIMQHRVVITNVPSSVDKKCRRGIRTQVKLTDTTYFFWDFVNYLFFFFLKKAHFGSRLCFCLQGKKHLTWWTTCTELFSITGHQSNLLWCEHENRPSSRALTGKWLMKNLEIMYRAQK
jgi:hypothetical protein